MKTSALRLGLRVVALPALLVLPLAAPAAPASSAGDDRVVRAAEGYRRDRAPDELRSPFDLTESRAAPGTFAVKPRGGIDARAHLSPMYGDAYVYDASVELFYDRDGDGYYHYLRVQFDADTIFDVMPVYAELYLSADGESWEHLYTSDTFRIYGSGPDDEYEIETELVSGYSSGRYDLLIELYDADYAELVDEFGPLESEAMAFLPLEDSARDGGGTAPPIHDSDGGGGAAGWPLIAALAAAVAGRRLRARGRQPADARSQPAGSMRSSTPGFWSVST